MKIAVCVSHVPDTATRIKIGADRKAIDPAGVTYIINPYDEFAVEEALKTKEKIGGDSLVYVITVGGEANKAVSYTHLRAHETVLDLVCRLLLEKKK